MKTQFDEPGTFPKVGPLGRLLRIVLGVLILYAVFPSFLQHVEAMTQLREGWETPGTGWIVAFVVSVYLLPHTVDRGFTLQLGYRSQLILAVIALGVVGFDLLYYGSLWGPPLGWFILLTIFFVLGHLGLSFIVAGAAATPG